MSDIIGRNEKRKEIACSTCIHFHRDNDIGFSCNAFVNIPDEIILGNNKHLKPLESQDNEIVYQSEK